MMKKNQKKQIIQLLDTLHNACQDLKKQKEEKFIALCGEIQNFTGSIYCFAGEILGQEHIFIKSLEDFYKELYLVSEGQSTIKQLLKEVHNLSVIAKSFKIDKFEIAFFCYKASMSDCFESVYFAAKQDPSCDAYFIPIPYYDRNPDGSFGTMHLEGVGYYSNKYELIDWQKYDVEARRPDVIFIMNPYDGNNLVTSVHPNFYSERLKNYTDCLIYIEYGVPLWMYKDCYSVKDKIGNEIALLPAHFYCDYYIAYQQAFVDFFKVGFNERLDLVQAYKMDKKTIDTKLIALGSPKFDKVLNSKKEDFILPKEWRDKIGDKKIVLYNTSLSELLKSSSQQINEEGSYLVKDDRYLNKLKSILDTFKDRQDVVLWWRPHPLFESTLKSMRPALYKYYMSIVQEYKTLNQGIFDTSEDVHRAICFSDAMISDESSILWLYLATGKPFYIPAISYALPTPIHQNDTYFYTPIQNRIANMKDSKGANIENINACVWWHNFCDEDFYRNIHFDNYLERFLRYVIPLDDYPEREEYERLQKQIFYDFVINSDGTAGQKIYEFAKEKAFEQ